MGFDLMGMHPENDEGEYFQANIWSWRRLWYVACSLSSDFLTDKQIEGGDTNDGKWIPKGKAIEMGLRLEKAYKNRMERNVRRIVDDSKKDYPDYGFEWPFALDFAKFLKSSGGFKIC